MYICRAFYSPLDHAGVMIPCCSVIQVVDRPGSFSISLQKVVGMVRNMRLLPARPTVSMDDQDNTEMFEAMLKVIRGSKKNKVRFLKKKLNQV